VKTRAWGEEYRTTTVCIDSYENGVMTGRFYNRYLEGGKQFESLTQFLTEMEQTLDRMDFPKAFTTTRTFAPQPPEIDSGQADHTLQKGTTATFTIRVLFRQNASWQGTVSWLEGEMEESFRSVLELILLMDSALSSAEGEPEF